MGGRKAKKAERKLKGGRLERGWKDGKEVIPQF
jgi:hypothetical protein